MDRARTSSTDPVWQLPEKIANMPLRLALSYLVWLVRLPPEKASEVANRLRLPGSLQEQLAAAGKLMQELDALPQLLPSQVAARLDAVPSPALYAIYLLLPASTAKDVLVAYIARWKHVQPITTGDDLRTLGIPPGPAYKEILTRLAIAGEVLAGHGAAVSILILDEEGLLRNGYLDLARELRQRTLDMICRLDDIYEYYQPETGEVPPKAASIFGWSSAVFIDLAIQAAKDNEVHP